MQGLLGRFNSCPLHTFTLREYFQDTRLTQAIRYLLDCILLLRGKPFFLGLPVEGFNNVL